MAMLGISFYRYVDMCILKSKILSGVLRVEKCGRHGGRGTHTLCISINRLLVHFTNRGQVEARSRFPADKVGRPALCSFHCLSAGYVKGGCCCLLDPAYRGLFCWILHAALAVTTYLDRQVILWQQHCEIDTSIFAYRKAAFTPKESTQQQCWCLLPFLCRPCLSPNQTHHASRFR